MPPLDIKAIFQQALNLEPGDRPAFLDRACGDQSEARARVEALLKALDDAGSFLEAPAIPPPGTDGDEPAPESSLADPTAANEPTPGDDPTVSIDHSPAAVPAGTRIGPYKLLQPIGEGGMGIVYMAEQTHPVRRKVALKVIKPGMDTTQVIARFEAERQALAMMNHPNIAGVLDVGATEQGRPFFVMELVKGVPITKYCDDARLSSKERLELFIPVCAAIQHAHQKGIIHRDVKPSNVLVTIIDGKPVPKVIDFGIAKATDQRLTERTMFTQFGAIVGTPEYMSPEQAEISGMDVDTRSDIYSLGVLLYELLTGSTPLDRETLRKAAYAEILRRIKEEEPPRPSTRISGSGDRLASIAAVRHTDPSKLTRLVSGDLDWIVMKSLEKDRNRRYETANAFAKDVRRYLEGDAVEACPPSARYKLGKFVRKHRAALSTVGAFALLLMTATAISSWMTYRATYAERLARQRLTRAETAEAEAKTQAQSARTQQKRAEDREAQAIAAVKRFGDAISNEPELKNTPALDGLRKRLLKEPLAFFRALRDRLQADRDTRPESLARLAQASYDLGGLTNAIGDKQDALIAYQESLAISQKLAQANPTVTAFQSGLAISHNDIGALLSDTGKHADALNAYESALAIRQKLADANPTDNRFQNALAASHNNIGALLSITGKPAAAMKAYESALAIQQKLADANSTITEFQTNLAASHNNIGILLSSSGKLTEALNAQESALAIRRKLADANPTIAEFQRDLTRSYNNVGNLLHVTEKWTEAMKAYESAFAIFQKLADASPTVTEFQRGLASSYYNIGIVLGSTGKPAEALKAYESALAIQQKLADANPTATVFQTSMALTYNNIGLLLRNIGKLAEARKAQESALAIRQKLADASPTVTNYQTDLLASLNNIGNLLTFAGKPDEAIKAFESARAIGQKLTREHPESPEFASLLGSSLNNMAVIDLDAKRYEEARVRFRHAIEWQRKALAINPTNPTYRQRVAGYLINLIKASRGLDDSEGVAEAERELAKLRGSDPAMVTLDERLYAVLEGQAPKDAAERLALAQRAYDKALYATAARLWAEALDSNPKLGDDRQNNVRYNAACAAALAASGHGKDEPTLDDATKTKLRTQAIGWLKAELLAWKRVSMTVGPGNKALVTKTMAHWKGDMDLASLREATAIAKLPDEEHAELQQLWADVDGLPTKVEGGK